MISQATVVERRTKNSFERVKDDIKTLQHALRMSLICMAIALAIVAIVAVL